MKVTKRAISDTSGSSKRIKLEHIEVEIESETTELAPNVFTKVDPEDMAKCNGPPKWSEIYNQLVWMRSKFLHPWIPKVVNECQTLSIETLKPETQNISLSTFNIIDVIVANKGRSELRGHEKLAQWIVKSAPRWMCIESVLKLSESEIDAYIKSWIP